MKHSNYRMKCRNPKCGYEILKRYSNEDFDNMQYGGTSAGIACFQCSFPAMAIIRSNQMIKDGFKPGFQRSIRKYCHTYSEYTANLKNMGLIEMGYDDIPKNEEGDIVDYWSDEVLKRVYDMGVQFSDNEAKALKKGYKMEDGLKI